MNSNPYFANEAAVEDRTFVVEAANEAYKAQDGWVMLAPYGRWPNAQGMQVFGQLDAQGLVKDFEHVANIGVRAMGIPFYIGHPDHPRFEDRYRDTRAYGRIKKLEARPEGLFGNVKWNEDGKRLIESEAFHGHSVNWRMQPVGPEWRPVSLKSVGFTNEPNIQVAPITSANERQNSMKSTALLLGLPDTATEAEINANLTTMANELKTAQATIAALKIIEAEHTAKKTEFANAAQRITALEGEKADLSQQVTTLTGERDKAQTAFANERKARGTAILDASLEAGRITQAERAGFETLMANEASFEPTVALITGRPATMKTKSEVPAGGNRQAGGQNRTQQIVDFVNEKIAEKHKLGITISYDDAFAAVQREKPALFTGQE